MNKLLNAFGCFLVFSQWVLFVVSIVLCIILVERQGFGGLVRFFTNG